MGVRPDPRNVNLSRVTFAETTRIRSVAARNNADWCASVCRSHGLSSSFGEMAWSSARRTPPNYPDAVTLHPNAVPTDFRPEIDTTSPGCSIKDSFAALDLTSDGFTVLFTAQWIHRPAGRVVPNTSVLGTKQVRTPAELREWSSARPRGDEIPDLFRPTLLEDPSVVVLAVRDGQDFHGGFALNRSSGVVGLSNLFAADGTHMLALWSAAVTAAAEHFPGLPIVGYEHGDDLAPALASGFTVLGALRVWIQNS